MPDPLGEICDAGVDGDCDGLIDCEDEADCPCTEPAAGALYANSSTELYRVKPGS